MLTKPDLADEAVAACLRDTYGFAAPEVAFLPLGYDHDAAVYRAAAGGSGYFVKLRRGAFDQTAVALPKWLSEHGASYVIPSVPTAGGRLWARLGEYRVIVYPFVEGRSGFQTTFNERHWRAFGKALRHLHGASPPADLTRRIAVERFDPTGRRMLRQFVDWPHDRPLPDAIAAELVAFLREQRAATLDLIERAERLADELLARPRDFVVCHGDVHAGNLLVDREDRLFIVDWDAPILAPKERDLMFPGGAQGFTGKSSAEEERLFYEGYGPAAVDPVALAYYRFERIIQDLYAFGEQLLLSSAGGEDRTQSLGYVKANFAPGSTIAAAYAADRRRTRAGGRGELRIRRYRADDHDAVWELHNVALHQVGAHGGNGPWDDDLHQIEQVYLASGGEFLVGERDGRVVAMGALKPTGAGRAEVKRMRVQPDQQRRGFGTAILSALEDRARQLGFELLHLDTTVQQTAAQRLYEKHGFRQVGRTTLGKFGCLLYEKRLADAHGGPPSVEERGSSNEKDRSSNENDRSSAEEGRSS